MIFVVLSLRVWLPHQAKSRLPEISPGFGAAPELEPETAAEPPELQPASTRAVAMTPAATATMRRRPGEAVLVVFRVELVDEDLVVLSTLLFPSSLKASRSGSRRLSTEV
jgi:hypothetical protein